MPESPSCHLQAFRGVRRHVETRRGPPRYSPFGTHGVVIGSLSSQRRVAKRRRHSSHRVSRWRSRWHNRP